MKTIISILIIALAGCSSAKYQRVGDQAYDTKPKSYVMPVYIKPDATPDSDKTVEEYLQTWGAAYEPIANLTSEYDLIGYIRSNGAALADRKKIFKKAVAQARHLGADAMIIKSIGYRPINVGTRTLNNPVIFADAIRYKK